MKTWSGYADITNVRILKNKVRLSLADTSGGAVETTILTPGQAMRLANKLRRWAMGNLRRAPDTSQWALTRSSERKAE
jgi:hypothetical protein